MQAVVLEDGVEGWENLEPGLGSSLSASLLAPGSLTPSSSSSSSSPSQDTAETPCPLTVSLLQDTALLGVPGGCLYPTNILEHLCISGTMPHAGDTNLGPDC